MAAASYEARASPTGPLAHLSSCIASVDFACQTLEDSNASLAEQTSDYARLSSVLRSRRHFDLVSESEIRRAREHLQAEIAPQLKELILRAEASQEQDERRSKILKSKVAQQAARLEQLAQIHNVRIDDVRQHIHGQGETQDNKTKMSTVASATSVTELQNLRDTAASLQHRRRAMQRELAMLERQEVAAQGNESH